MPSRSISVVIPCFNEGKTIYQNIEKIKAYLADNFVTFEIIAVNDGSLDNTREELGRSAQDFGIRVINNEINRGKGKAVRDGVLVSQYEIVMFLDADLAIPVEEVDKFCQEIENGYSVVIASRFVPGLNVASPILWYRKIMERIFRILRMIIISNFQVKDTQCGFKMFTRRSAMDIFPVMTVERFAFDAEIIFIASKKKYTIRELPITLQNPIRSSIRIWRDSANMLMDLVRIRRNNFLGKYD